MEQAAKYRKIREMIAAEIPEIKEEAKAIRQGRRAKLEEANKCRTIVPIVAKTVGTTVLQYDTGTADCTLVDAKPQTAEPCQFAPAKLVVYEK